MNEAEEYVHELCRSSFLSLWTVENPIGPKKGKELSDALVVVGADLVVISVKERNVKPSGDIEVDAGRWYRDAVEGSVKQLRGASRALGRMTEVRRTDNPDVVLQLPPVSERRVHFVAVALGGESLVPTAPEQHDFGMVHVFDRPTFDVVLRELDTITDFLDFIRAKEQFLDDTQVVLEGGEWDLLAVYLREGRSFPAEPNALFLTDGLWEQLADEAAFLRRKQADEASYAWDKLIEEFAGHLRGGTLLGGATQDQTQIGLRYMARESRFHRRVLGDSFITFLRKAGAGQAQSRWSVAPSGVVYVFLVCPRTASPDRRAGVLLGYCSVLMERHPEAPAVVGIMTERPDGDWRMSFALMTLEPPVTDEIRAYAEEARSIGIPAQQVPYESHVREYPEE